MLGEGLTITKAAVQGDVHRYEVLLTTGDFFDVSVTQDQILVALSARGPEGVLHTINLPSIDPWPERLMFVASVPGRYVFEVTFEAPFVSPGVPQRGGTGATGKTLESTLHVQALRAATPEDRRRAAWFETVERANALVHQQSLEGLQKAIPLFLEAAAGWRSVGDVALEISTVEALANVTGFFTRFNRESAAARERLTELYAGIGSRKEEMETWRLLAEEYREGGRVADAKQAAGRALRLAEDMGLRSVAAKTRRQLASFEFELGNYDQSRDLAGQVREAAAELSDPVLEAAGLLDLARLDEVAGDLEAATARYRRALDLAAGQRVLIAAVTMSLGFNHLARGELDEAASRFEARLAMSPTKVLQDPEALTRLGLGDVARARGDRAEARRRYEAAASALEKGLQSYRCIAEQRVGRLDLEEGRFDQARVRFDTMLQIARTIHRPSCEAEARAGLADLAAERGDLETADAEARRVVELTETFRAAAVSLESRSLGFGAFAPAYERAIDISMRRADGGDTAAIARALALNEQALARGLLDKVTETRLDSRTRVPAALATERHQVRERWRARLAQLQVATRTRPDGPETKALLDETQALAVQVRDLDARIDAADPRHASFLGPRPLGVAGMQALLDENTLLLEYALGEARSYLWVVSSRDVRALTLPPRAEIEALARRVHESLARSPAAPGSARRAGEEDLRALTRLLIEPAAPQLSAKRLVLVVSGALSLIPFGALPQPGTAVHPLPMLAKHEIVQVPSATILGAMRTLTAGRARPTRTAAIFADPIFDAQDPRVQPRAQSASVRGGTPPDPARLRGVALTRLPFSRGEAEAISSLASRSVSTFMGSEATRERALARALYDYRFIHFATHGIVNQDVPSLSSLVLSLIDRSGQARDGFVMVPDIYDMTLNADVVVLSGCQTALGKQIRGEGPIGLARAFMYAGVPRVVASLWPVDDLATAELMKRFYRGMLVNRLAPAAALRRAQQELAADRRWASPYFWAPFVLQGDWR